MAHETSPAIDAYEPLAPHYDLLTKGYAYDRWIANLDRLLRELGLPGNRVLDVGCGTGHAIGPLQRLGYDVTACDVAPGMVARARDSYPEARPFVADMRELGDVGSFDVVLCLDDAVNYLLDDDDLAHAMRSVAGALTDDGLFVFDTNTELTYRTAFAADRVAADEHRLLVWRGHGMEPEAPCFASATIEIFSLEEGGPLWRRSRSEHRQRLWSEEDIEQSARAGCLEVERVLGQRTGGVLEPTVDESRHTKLVHVMRKR